MSAKKTPASNKTQASLTSFFKRTPQTSNPDACEDITNVSKTSTPKPFTPPIKKPVEKRAEPRTDEPPQTPELVAIKSNPEKSDSKGAEPRKKRRRVIMSDSDDESTERKVDQMEVELNGSDDEYVPPKEESDHESSKDETEIGEDEDMEDIGKIKASYKAKKPVKPKTEGKIASVFLSPHMNSTPKPVKSGSYTPASRGLSDHSKSLLTSYNAEDSFNESVVEQMEDFVEYKHTGFAFLKPENLRDAERRKTSDPNYNPRTLHVPSDFMKKQTPGHQQWWKFKALHFDTILMFKVGKFYELYHMDAEIAVRELNLTYMKGDYAHCGFPEIAYGRFADQLVQRGHKVARIEQVETPNQLEERRKSRGSIGPIEKVVQREVCRITTPGTLTHSHMDMNVQKPPDSNSPAKSDSGVSASTSDLSQSSTSNRQFHSRLLVAFCEKLAQFEDDAQRTTLRTLLAHHPPSQFIIGISN